MKARPPYLLKKYSKRVSEFDSNYYQRMKRITRNMAREDSDSDEVELITQEQFIHSTRLIKDEEEYSFSQSIVSPGLGHAKLPLFEDPSTPYIPPEIEDVLCYEPVHSPRTIEKYFKKCKEILKRRHLGRWEKEFLMKLLHRNKHKVEIAENFVEKFEESFDLVIQKEREEEGKRLLLERLKKKK